MTATVHAGTPADALAGLVNALVADVLALPCSAVLPHARLREDLGARYSDMESLAYGVADRFDLDINRPPGGEWPEDTWLTVADLAAWIAERFEVPA